MSTERNEVEGVAEAAPAEGGSGHPGSHHPEAASRGGKAIVDKYGREYMSSLGRKGSQAVVRKYGLRFYSEIAARNKGVKKRRRSDPM